MDFPRLERLPPYVLAEVASLMRKARQEGRDIINLGMGNPDLPTPPHVVEKLIEAAQKPVNHRYSLSRGIPKLREETERYREKMQNELLALELELLNIVIPAPAV